MEDTEHWSVLTVVWHESVNDLINVRIITNTRPGTHRNEFDIERNRPGHNYFPRRAVAAFLRAQRAVPDGLTLPLPAALERIVVPGLRQSRHTNSSSAIVRPDQLPLKLGHGRQPLLIFIFKLLIVVVTWWRIYS